MFPVIPGLRFQGSLFYGWLVSGMLVIGCCALTGCGGSDPAPISARTSQFEVDDAAVEPPRDTTPGPSIGDDLLDQGEAPADIDLQDLTPGRPDSPQVAAPKVTAPEGVDPAVAPPAQPEQPPQAPRFDPVGQVDLSELDPAQLPDSAAELLKLLEALQASQPSGRTPQEQMEEFLSIQFTRLKAAERLWELAEDQEARMTAVQTKVDSLRILNRFQVPDTEKELHKYCRALLELDDPEIAFFGRLVLFRLAVEDLAAGVEEVDLPTILEELEVLAAQASKNPNTFMMLSDAAGVFFQSGNRDAALQAYRTIGQTFQDSEDEEEATEAAVMLERVRILEAEMDIQLQAFVTGEVTDEAPLVQTIETLVNANDAGMGTLIEMGQVATVLEMTDHHKVAKQVYEKIQAAFAQHSDADLAELAEEISTNGLRHVALLGEPLEITGVKLDGSPFDWSKYEGKVVLVSFWTWTDPCLYEISNIIQAYQQYRDRGFEVVGVNLDEDTSTVRRFMDIQPLPWVIVVSDDPEKQGPQNPLAVHCGVDLLPFAVLLDREGKVVALHARQHRLHEKLQELLGPPADGLPGFPQELEAPSPVVPN